MLYKTIVLELLQQNPRLHDHLRRSRTMMQTLDRYSALLRANHEEWMTHLTSIEAMELALQELEAALLTEFPPDDDPFPLDQAMAHVRRHLRPD